MNTIFMNPKVTTSRWIKSKNIEDNFTSYLNSSFPESMKSSKRAEKNLIRIRKLTSMNLMESIGNLSDTRNFTYFRRAIKSIIGLVRISRQLKNRDRRIVKLGLSKVQKLANDPNNSAILEDVGICLLLVNLLNLDSIVYWDIVGPTLKILYCLSINSQCSLALIKNSLFLIVMENYLKSDGTNTQKIAAYIICRCFHQPVHREDEVVRLFGMRKLLFKCLSVPFPECVIDALSILEELTYHCSHCEIIFGSSTLKRLPNSKAILDEDFSEIDDIAEEFFSLIVSFISYDSVEKKYISLNILRNVILTMAFSVEVLRTIIPHSASIEATIIRSIQGYSNAIHKTPQKQNSGNISRSTSNFGDDLNVRRIPLSRRKSSTFRALSKPLLSVGDDTDPELRVHAKEEFDIGLEILFALRSSKVIQMGTRKSIVQPLQSYLSFKEELYH